MIVTTPSSNDTTVTNLFKQKPSIKVDAGCTIEYNMNYMVNNVVVTGPADDVINNNTPFTALFKLDTLVKQNRPECAGIKYYVLGDVSSKSYASPKNITYPYNSRLYMPGVDTTYKYYLTPVGNGSSKTITATYPKAILVNKVVVKFELGHTTPTSCIISGSSGTYLDATSGIIPFPADPFNKAFNEGTTTIYYTGSGWSLLESALAPDQYVSTTQIQISVGVPTGKNVGIIEIAPILVKDISSNIVSFDIQKESSSSESDLLPVGYISANSLLMSINDYNKSLLTVLSYIKNLTVIEGNKIYLYKYSKLKPYLKIFHSAGTYGTTNKYDKVVQGTYYMDSWSVSEYGEASITALDGAKILQETLCPEIFCEGYSATAIIRRLLDSVGFTNYKINIKSPIAEEQSIITPAFWWSEDNKTVWQVLQELCKDTQMTAVFDESNVLQFYSRDYLYDSTRSSSWTFSDILQGGTDLPNIISMDKNDLPSINKVKILWQSALSSVYTQGASVLWKSPTSFLGALSLVEDLPSSSGAGAFMKLIPITTDQYSDQQSLYEFGGYLLIDSEIIEYDAIEYQYEPLASTTLVTVNIQSQSDVFKYRSLAKSGYANLNDPTTAYFRPSGRYRIKTRGAFGTTAANHIVDPKNTIAGWTTKNEIVWGA